MNSIEKALSMGLAMIPMPSGVLRRYTRDLQQGKKVDSIYYCTIHKTHGPSAGSDVPRIEDWPIQIDVYWVTDDTFLFRVWEGHPGPKESDFIAHFRTFDAVLDAATALYFGKPTVIDIWNVPLHHHPELEEAQVRAALTKAQIVTLSAFQTTQQQYYDDARKRFPNEPWERALTGTFLQIPHVSDPQRSGMLLRNGQVAFIVQA